MNALLLIVTILVSSFSISAQFITTKSAKKAGEALARGERAAAVRILDQAIAGGKDLEEAHELRGDIRAMSGDLDGAIADFTEVIKLDPSKASVREKRAQFRLFRRDSTGALEDLNSAISLGSRTERNFVDRARVRGDVGDITGAKSDFQTALGLNPNLASAHVGLGVLYENVGETDAAVMQLQEFLDVYEGKRAGKLPKSPTSDGTSNVLVEREGKEKDGSQQFLGISGAVRFEASTPDEMKKVQARIEQVQNISLAYLTLGRLLAGKGELDRAVALYDKGISISKDNTYGYMLRSEARMKKGDLNGTIADLTTVMNLPMRSPGHHLDKGILLILQGKDDEAEKEFEVHLQRFPAGREAVNRKVKEAKELLKGSQPTSL